MIQIYFEGTGPIPRCPSLATFQHLHQQKASNEGKTNKRRVQSAVANPSKSTLRFLYSKSLRLITILTG